MYIISIYIYIYLYSSKQFHTHHTSLWSYIISLNFRGVPCASIYIAIILVWTRWKIHIATEHCLFTVSIFIYLLKIVFFSSSQVSLPESTWITMMDCFRIPNILGSMIPELIIQQFCTSSKCSQLGSAAPPWQFCWSSKYNQNEFWWKWYMYIVSTLYV